VEVSQLERKRETASRHRGTLERKGVWIYNSSPSSAQSVVPLDLDTESPAAKPGHAEECRGSSIEPDYFGGSV
jgi:hypothetical protein